MAISYPRLVHGIVFLVLLVGGAIACFFLLIPWVPLTFIPSKSVYLFRRQIVAFINKLYFLYAVFLLEYVAGIKITIHSETPDFMNDDNIFVISNHRTRVDWMFSAWVHAAYLHVYPFLVLVLKDELKNVPFYGWCMQVMVYMFLSRKKDNDLPHMRRCFDYYRLMPSIPSSMFIFPEGTDLHAAAIAKSDAFADEKQLPRLEYVLFPRPAGFLLCLSEARARKAILHDITVAYKDCIPGRRTSEVDFLFGTFPKEVHLFVRRVPVADVPEEESDAKEWLIRCFQEKEALLKQFYSSISKLDSNQTVTTASESTSANPQDASAPKDVDHFANYPYVQYRKIPLWSRVVVPLCQMALIAFVEYYLWMHAPFGWVVGIVYLLHMLVFAAAPLYGGMDKWEMDRSALVFEDKKK